MAGDRPVVSASKWLSMLIVQRRRNEASPSRGIMFFFKYGKTSFEFGGPETCQSSD